MPYAVRLRDKLLVQIPLPATAECFRLHRLAAMRLVRAHRVRTGAVLALREP
jgi:hypothetical protein